MEFLFASIFLVWNVFYDKCTALTDEGVLCESCVHSDTVALCVGGCHTKRETKSEREGARQEGFPYIFYCNNREREQPYSSLVMGADSCEQKHTCRWRVCMGAGGEAGGRWVGDDGVVCGVNQAE